MTHSPALLEDERYFVICVGCGKIYWPGSHYSAFTTNAKKCGLNLTDHNDSV